MKNFTRAGLKRAAKHFRIGDYVTWGRGAIANQIVQITKRGVYVDVTNEKDAVYFASRRVGSRLHLFVAFDSNNRNSSGRGPLHRRKEP